MIELHGISAIVVSAVRRGSRVRMRAIHYSIPPQEKAAQEMSELVPVEYLVTDSNFKKTTSCRTGQ